MRSPSLYRAAVALAALVAAACGSSGNSAATDLKAVFYKQMSNAPVVTYTLQRQNAQPMTASVLIDTQSIFNGWKSIGSTRTVNTNGSGVASVALSKGTYPVTITATGTGATLVGRLNESLSVSGDTNRTYQTSQQNWNVTAPAAFNSAHISIYQTDSNGKALYSTALNAANPLILDANVSFGSSATSQSFNTELFKGTYRAVITATGNATPFETVVFNAAGGGATEAQPAISITNLNIITLSLMDNGAAIPNGPSVKTFDKASLIPLGTTTYTATGGAVINTGSVADVVVMVTAADGSLMALQAATASASGALTLNRYAVSGHVKTPTGNAITPNGGNYGQVNAFLQTSLGEPWATQIAQWSSGTAQITDGLGTYSLKLIDASYNVRAQGVPTLPTSKSASVAVSGAAATLDVPIDAGGVISGNVQTAGHNNVNGVSVSVYDSTHTVVGSSTTGTDGNFSVAVPYGTFDVFVGGSLSASPNVSASSSTASLSLTQFQVNGRLTDSLANGVAGTVRWGGGSTTALALGTYSINVVQGLNWFLFSPPSTSSTIGFVYEPLVQVDSNTIKSLP